MNDLVNEILLIYEDLPDQDKDIIDSFLSDALQAQGASPAHLPEESR